MVTRVATRQPVLSVLSIVVGVGALSSTFMVATQLNNQFLLVCLAFGGLGVLLAIIALKKEKSSHLWLVGLILSAFATTIALAWTVMTNIYVFLNIF